MRTDLPLEAIVMKIEIAATDTVRRKRVRVSDIKALCVIVMMTETAAGGIVRLEAINTARNDHRVISIRRPPLDQQQRPLIATRHLRADPRTLQPPRYVVIATRIYPQASASLRQVLIWHRLFCYIVTVCCLLFLVCLF
jgi:hypothetical protein